jgi:DNA recombination protein RmuC
LPTSQFPEGRLKDPVPPIARAEPFPAGRRILQNPTDPVYVCLEFADQHLTAPAFPGGEIDSWNSLDEEFRQMSQSTIVTLAFALMSGVIGMFLGYLWARSRSAAVQAGELATHRERDQQLGRVSAELEAARDEVRRLRDAATRAGAEREAVDREHAELFRKLQELREQHAVAESTKLRAQDDLAKREQELDALKQQQQALDVKAAEITAARSQLQQVQTDQQKLLEKNLLAMSTSIIERGSSQLLGSAERQLSAVSKPVHEQLKQLDQHLRDLNAGRASTEARLGEQLSQLAGQTEEARKEARALAEALRKPQIRGSWGEQHLKRSVELAGMTEHCDFSTQETITSSDGIFRPDMIVRLAGGKQAIIDAKVPLDAILEAAGTADDQEKQEALRKRHARQLRMHVDMLSAKDYQRQLPCTPEFVVLYLPGESFLEPAVSADPNLLEHAFGKRVIIATPTTLIAMLRTIAFAWTQAALADSLQEVSELGRELYNRLTKMGEHFGTLGARLNSSVSAYNETVGSMEGRVMVTARKFRALKVVEGTLQPLKAIDASVRQLTALDLLDTASSSALHADLRVQRVELPDDGVETI